MKRAKTAAIYDKWLSQLGGGEMVACTAAKLLRDHGYRVTFITGKEVPAKIIKKKLGIDLKGIEFVTAWNHEAKIKRISYGKDLFVNFSFMDYSKGYAKKNIYYTHFPSKPYKTLGGSILNFILLPAIIRGFIPQEPIEGEVQVSYNHVVYPLAKRARFSFYYLSPRKTYRLQFKIILAQFSKSFLEKIDTSIEGAKIQNSRVEVDHRNNIVKITSEIIPLESTIYLNVQLQESKETDTKKENKAFLIYKPQIYHFFNVAGYFDFLQKRLNSRFRAGLFRNAIKNLFSYDEVLANSEFTKYWIKKYWKREAVVLHPPVHFMSNKRKISPSSKRNWITSVGRFFIKGHGKKQEALIKAFKNLHDKGFKNWELHLIGGASNDAATLNFIQRLKKESAGYPIFLHLNIERGKVKKILIKTRIYWHATGLGENEQKKPILFEHFGIAPLEAITVDCIPLLYNGGGLSEIIRALQLRSEKHLFSNIDELIRKTIYFMKHDSNINWQKVYYLLEKNFSEKAFRTKLLEIIA